MFRCSFTHEKINSQYATRGHPLKESCCCYPSLLAMEILCRRYSSIAPWKEVMRGYCRSSGSSATSESTTVPLLLLPVWVGRRLTATCWPCIFSFVYAYLFLLLNKGNSVRHIEAIAGRQSLLGGHKGVQFCPVEQ